MINKSEKQERQYLEDVKQRLKNVLNQIDKNINEHARELHEGKKYLYENKTGMDHVEKISVRQSITQRALTGEAAIEKKKRLQKVFDSPFFGRIDFMENVNSERLPIYIGIHSFYDESENKNIVYDWRAPVSSMYYDFELGKAFYDAPSGEISGEILLKRQYRIKRGKMEFMLENSVNTHDDILQHELSKASDEKMKNIVATIQHDQNAIIRNESSRVLIIQGVAGSGKTSIALHRVAFLLYRFNENLKSKDILIISPNKVFADYISNVLPELGEEKVPEKGMEELADELLEGKVKFQSFHEQVDKLLNKSEKAFSERIKFKSSFIFLNQLDEYISYIENEYFEPKDIWVRRYPVPKWFIMEKFQSYHRLPLLTRFNKIAGDIEENIRFYYNYDINGQERNEIRKVVKSMFKITNLRGLYKDFFVWLGKIQMFKLADRSRLEYADLFPFIYLKIKLEGNKPFDNVKHLLVDEMQDYTALQYAVLSRLFLCNKTILGDMHQSVNPYSSSAAAEITKVFPDADFVKLCKSYRSTYEIITFAQSILSNDELIAIERYGEKPLIKQTNNHKEETLEIVALIDEFNKTKYKSLGIICKTYAVAKKLKEQLTEFGKDISLLTPQSHFFTYGVMITTVHMSKGLEFDQVIVPFASEENYKNNFDRSLLYIACTRAMHKLNLTCNGGVSPLIKSQN